MLINVRRYQRANQKWTNQRNWQYRVEMMKKKKYTAICVGHHFAQTNTQDIIHVNNTQALLQTTGGKDEPNNGYVQKSLWTLQLETQNGLYADAR